MKTLFWIIVAVCVVSAFPAVGVGAVVLVVFFFITCFVAVWTKDRREMKQLEEERKQAEARRRELEAMDRKWAQAAAERREQQRKIEAEKKVEDKKDSRDRAERIAKYNRLAKEAAAEGDTETAECWRRLAVEELKKYTNRF